MKKVILSLLCLATLGSYAQEYKGTSTFGTINIETVIAAELHHQNELITAGLFQSPFVLGDDTAVFNGGNADAYFAKYDANGEVQMLKCFGGWADESMTAITSDNEGSFYLTGYFQGNKNGGTPFDADPSAEGQFILSQPGALLTRDCFIIKLDANGDFVWARQISNTEYGSNEDSKAIVVDNMGGLYVGGTFAQANFGTEEEPNIILTESGKHEGFLMKLDAATGETIWLNHWYGGATIFEDLAIDTENQSLIALGSFTRTMHPGTDSITLTGPLRDASGFLSRISLDGELEWITHFGGEGRIISDQVILLDNGDIVAGGRFNKTATFAPNDTVNEITGKGGYDLWWSGFDANGTFQYNKTFGGKGIETLGTLQQDKNGNLLIAALFTDTSTFTSSNETLALVSKGGADIVLLNMSPEGDYLDNLTIGGEETHGIAHAFVNDNGDVLVSGNFVGTVDFNPYEGEDFHTALGTTYDGFISRFEWSAVSTSITEKTSGIAFNAYPNPTKDVLHVSGENLSKYQVVSVGGNVVARGEVKHAQISLTHLPAGTYLVRVADTNGNSGARLIVKQ